ncbi:hypothetical protein Y032_0021g404 [Ancylostoma ceylanicum]|uniref:Uncharacterized protein n=1 Tax=Ancylostoma ceylanicum TaxID=53326 RepID=A0A016V0G9_9BILA|nr:hypothetical protein Y032_0021g404 [Ancylostoma ceylanicum]
MCHPLCILFEWEEHQLAYHWSIPTMGGTFRFSLKRIRMQELCFPHIHLFHKMLCFSAGGRSINSYVIGQHRWSAE